MLEGDKNVKIYQEIAKIATSIYPYLEIKSGIYSAKEIDKMYSDCMVRSILLDKGVYSEIEVERMIEGKKKTISIPSPESMREIVVDTFSLSLSIHSIFAVLAKVEKIYQIPTAYRVSFTTTDTVEKVDVVSLKITKEMKSVVAAADPKDTLRPVCQGMYIDIKNNYVASTEGHILNIIPGTLNYLTTDREIIEKVSGVIVPADTIKKNVGRTMIVSLTTEGEIVCSIDSAKVDTIPGNYPRYKNVLPNISTTDTIRFKKSISNFVKECVSTAKNVNSDSKSIYSHRVYLYGKSGDNYITIYAEDIDYDRKSEKKYQIEGVVSTDFITYIDTNNLKRVNSVCDTLYLCGVDRCLIFAKEKECVSLLMPLPIYDDSSISVDDYRYSISPDTDILSLIPTTTPTLTDTPPAADSVESVDTVEKVESVCDTPTADTDTLTTPDTPTADTDSEIECVEKVEKVESVEIECVPGTTSTLTADTDTLTTTDTPTADTDSEIECVSGTTDTPTADTPTHLVVGSNYYLISHIESICNNYPTITPTDTDIEYLYQVYTDLESVECRDDIQNYYYNYLLLYVAVLVPGIFADTDTLIDTTTDSVEIVCDTPTIYYLTTPDTPTADSESIESDTDSEEIECVSGTTTSILSLMKRYSVIAATILLLLILSLTAKISTPTPTVSGTTPTTPTTYTITADTLTADSVESDTDTLTTPDTPTADTLIECREIVCVPGTTSTLSTLTTPTDTLTADSVIESVCDTISITPTDTLIECTTDTLTADSVESIESVSGTTDTPTADSESVESVESDTDSVESVESDTDTLSTPTDTPTADSDTDTLTTSTLTTSTLSVVVSGTTPTTPTLTISTLSVGITTPTLIL